MRVASCCAEHRNDGGTINKRITPVVQFSVRLKRQNRRLEFREVVNMGRFLFHPLVETDSGA